MVLWEGGSTRMVRMICCRSRIAQCVLGMNLQGDLEESKGKKICDEKIELCEKDGNGNRSTKEEEKGIAEEANTKRKKKRHWPAWAWLPPTDVGWRRTRCVLPPPGCASVCSHRRSCTVTPGRPSWVCTSTGAPAAVARSLCIETLPSKPSRMSEPPYKLGPTHSSPCSHRHPWHHRWLPPAPGWWWTACCVGWEVWICQNWSTRNEQRWAAPALDAPQWQRYSW